MTQSDLNEAVAAKTGESLLTIRRRGFSVITPLAVLDPDDHDAPPQMIDWDRLDAERRRTA